MWPRLPVNPTPTLPAPFPARPPVATPHLHAFPPSRLAAAGNAEAIEALRVSGSLSTSFPSSKPDAEGGSHGGGGTDGTGHGSGGFTPLTVLPVLLALVGAGYCVVNDLVPREWLWRIGGGGSGGGAGSGDSARAEGRSTHGEEAKDVSSLSPLLRTLSRVAAFVPVGSSTAATTSADSTAPAPAPARTQGGGEVISEAASGSSSPTAANGEGQGHSGGWTLWGWWRREREGAVDGKGDDVVMAVFAEPHVGEVDGAGQDDTGGQRQQRQQQQQPRWLRRAG